MSHFHDELVQLGGSTSPSTQDKKFDKKKVSFSADTYFSDEYNIAASILSHEYLKEAGHTVYTIKMIFRGNEWSFVKRYRDFEQLHNNLLKESCNSSNVIIPRLPQKRWFETARWINRNDSDYSMKRRMALEEYFRSVIKIPTLKKVSYALHEFVNESGAILFTHEDKIYFENDDQDKKRWWAQPEVTSTQENENTETETENERISNTNIVDGRESLSASLSYDESSNGLNGNQLILAARKDADKPMKKEYHDMDVDDGSESDWI